MSDRYQQLVTSGLGRTIAQQFGLPTPVELRRHQPGDPVVHGPVLLGGSKSGRLVDATSRTLKEVGAEVKTDALTSPDAEPAEDFAAIIYDASGVEDSSDLFELYDFVHSAIRHLKPSSRVIVLGTPPDRCDAPRQATAQRALEGFTRSVGKEMRAGGTTNLMYVEPGGEEAVDSTLRFLLSGRSAYVSGQVIRVGDPAPEPLVSADDPERPLDGLTAVVTGAAQGIGEAIAETLARDGAHVVAVDLPMKGDQLTAVVNRIGGSSLQLDITDDDAAAELIDHLQERHDGVDIVIHNAGVTRDKTIAGMDADRWNMVIDVNLAAQERINEALLERDVLREHGRIVCVSSTSGIAGNRGQANYAASKAGIIGMVHALAPQVKAQKATINAVAPGFIETEMTGEMPFAAREVGRRINSLAQGGLPVDVAETIAWLSQPATAGVNGQVVRVCGQSMIGA
ncbi:MAG: 3-oxoacyl-ACP reductase [Nitriliruptorales bacterium]|nr:3-oxoacyl-ACP reductase [Nitriliruptorales bacterium]